VPILDTEASGMDETQSSAPKLNSRLQPAEECACPHTTYVWSSARNPAIGRMTPKN
jgi:hypothetical protein